MPLPVMAPPPVPALLAVMTNCLSAKVAVTTFAGASSATWQGLVPVQPPLKPTNVLLAAGVALSCTVGPLNVAMQVAPQLMPAGVDVTVPLPAPAGCTETVAVETPIR